MCGALVNTSYSLQRRPLVRYLEVQCAAALRKMLDPKPALADKLTSQDSSNAVSKQIGGHADTTGCNSSNDTLAESVFGTFDYILRRFGGISQEAASGMAQAVRSKVLALGDKVAHRKTSKRAEAEQQPAFLGWFHTIPAHEQEAIVELARVTVVEMREIDLTDHRELQDYRRARRASNEEEELSALITKYALALSFYDRRKARGVQTAAQVTSKLRSMGEEGECTQV